MSNAIKLC